MLPDKIIGAEFDLEENRELVKGKVNVVKRSFNLSAAVLRVLNLDDIVS